MNNRTTLRRLLALMLWACALVIISTQVNSFILTVAANGPSTALIPLNAPPVAQNDAYGVNQNTTLNIAAPGVLGNDTDLDSSVLTATLVSNPSNGVVTFNNNGSFAYTPNKDFAGSDSFNYVASDGTNDSNIATVKIQVRSITFRANIKDIDKGECVLFSWVVKGDVNIVEFEEWDDGRDPVLVAEIGEREECPVIDTKYQLIVKWLDGSKNKEEKIEIEVDETEVSNEDSDSSGGSDSSSSGTSPTNNTAAPSAGAFVMVTPVLITNTGGSVSPTPIPVASENTVATPEGVLGGVKMLPETGSLPAPLPPRANVSQSSDHNVRTSEFQDEPLLTPISAIGILLGAIIIGWLVRLKIFVKPAD